MNRGGRTLVFTVGVLVMAVVGAVVKEVGKKVRGGGPPATVPLSAWRTFDALGGTLRVAAPCNPQPKSLSQPALPEGLSIEVEECLAGTHQFTAARLYGGTYDLAKGVEGVKSSVAGIAGTGELPPWQEREVTVSGLPARHLATAFYQGERLVWFDAVLASDGSTGWSVQLVSLAGRDARYSQTEMLISSIEITPELAAQASP